MFGNTIYCCDITGEDVNSLLNLKELALYYLSNETIEGNNILTLSIDKYKKKNVFQYDNGFQR